MPAEILWDWKHFVKTTDKDLWKTYEKAKAEGTLLQWVDRYLGKTIEVKSTEYGKEVVGLKRVVIMDEKMSEILAIKVFVPLWKFANFGEKDVKEVREWM